MIGRNTFAAKRAFAPPDAAYDVVIAACGADERAYKCVRDLSGARKATAVVLFDFAERRMGTISEDEKKRYYSYEDLETSYHLLDCSVSDRSCSMRSFIAKMTELGGTRVALDVSVFTKPYFFAVLRALRDYVGIRRADVLYTEPLSYLKADRAKYEFNRGRFEVVEIPGFNGISGATADKKLLIILLGFEGPAATVVNEDVGPTETIAVNGFPAYHFHYKDISILENSSLLADQGIRRNLAYAPASDPFEAFNAIDEIVRARPGCSVTLAPLGTKPMALGAALYALHNPSVRVVYPVTADQEHRLAASMGPSWLFETPLA